MPRYTVIRAEDQTFESPSWSGDSFGRTLVERRYLPTFNTLRRTSGATRQAPRATPPRASTGRSVLRRRGNSDDVSWRTCRAFYPLTPKPRCRGAREPPSSSVTRPTLTWCSSPTALRVSLRTTRLRFCPTRRHRSGCRDRRCPGASRLRAGRSEEDRPTSSAFAVLPRKSSRKDFMIELEHRDPPDRRLCRLACDRVRQLAFIS